MTISLPYSEHSFKPRPFWQIWRRYTPTEKVKHEYWLLAYFGVDNEGVTQEAYEIIDRLPQHVLQNPRLAAGIAYVVSETRNLKRHGLDSKLEDRIAEASESYGRGIPRYRETIEQEMTKLSIS